MSQTNEIKLRRLSGLVSSARELAHALKNHLNVAIGSTEMLLGTQLEGSQQQDLSRTLLALERMNSLITLCQRLLRAGDTRRVNMDPASLVGDLVADMGPILKTRGRKLVFESDGDTGTVLADRDSLLGFLTTILAGEQSGSFRLRLFSERLQEDPVLPAGDYVALSIQGDELPTSRGLWSLPAEILTFRIQGGDLRETEGELLLILPRG